MCHWSVPGTKIHASLWNYGAHPLGMLNHHPLELLTRPTMHQMLENSSTYTDRIFNSLSQMARTFSCTKVEHARHRDQAQSSASITHGFS